jgi:hypothetical protein
MARSEAKRQKRLAKQKMKRQQKRQALQRTRTRTLSLAEQMREASSGEILDCIITDGLETGGLGSLLFSRRNGASEVALSYLLVDLYCLGVKDAMARILSLSAYRDFVANARSKLNFEKIDPATARRLVEDAIEFAAEADYRPHRDYLKAAPLWGDLDPEQALRTYPMGKDGKHLRILGPADFQDELFDSEPGSPSFTVAQFE